MCLAAKVSQYYFSKKKINQYHTYVHTYTAKHTHAFAFELIAQYMTHIQSYQFIVIQSAHILYFFRSGEEIY